MRLCAQSKWPSLSFLGPKWLNIRANKLKPASPSIKKTVDCYPTPNFGWMTPGKISKHPFDIKGLSNAYMWNTSLADLWVMRLKAKYRKYRGRTR